MLHCRLQCLKCSFFCTAQCTHLKQLKKYGAIKDNFQCHFISVNMTCSRNSRPRPLTPVDVCEEIPKFHDGYYKTTVEGIQPADPYVMKVTGSKLQHFNGRGMIGEDTVEYGQVNDEHFHLCLLPPLS